MKYLVAAITTAILEDGEICTDPKAKQEQVDGTQGIFVLKFRCQERKQFFSLLTLWLDNGVIMQDYDANHLVVFKAVFRWMQLYHD